MYALTFQAERAAEGVADGLLEQNRRVRYAQTDDRVADDRADHGRGCRRHAAEINKHTIKFATAGAIGSPIALGMDKFAEIVKEKSGGQITVKRFPGGTLGGDVQTISALQGGTVEMTTMNAGILASVAKDFALVDLPFLFETPKEADAVMDGPVGATLAAESRRRMALSASGTGSSASGN